MARSSNVRDLNAKRKREREEAGGAKKKRPRKFKRQSSYHSSSEDDDDGTKRAKLMTGPNSEPTQARRIAKAQAAPIETDAALDADGIQGIMLQDDEVVADENNKPDLDEIVADEDDEPNLDEVVGDEDDEPNLDESTGDEDDNTGVELEDAGPEHDEDDDDEDDEEEEDSDAVSATTSTASAQRRKRNDPARFATSISKILDSKLTTSKRADPVLSRSKAATEASQDLAESRLEAKARRKLREDKKATQERGRVRDVLGVETADVSTATVAEQERRLKKMAQRGVVKLFNAVRAAQVKAADTMKEVKSVDTDSHLVGTDRRQEKVNEMSKKGFLDMLVAGEAS